MLPLGSFVFIGAKLAEAEGFEPSMGRISTHNELQGSDREKDNQGNLVVLFFNHPPFLQCLTNNHLMYPALVLPFCSASKLTWFNTSSGNIMDVDSLTSLGFFTWICVCFICMVPPFSLIWL